MFSKEFIEDYEQYEIIGDNAKVQKIKSADELMRQLKLFYARSKLILIITDGNYKIVDEAKAQEYLNPFLKRKILVIKPNGESGGKL